MNYSILLTIFITFSSLVCLSQGSHEPTKTLPVSAIPNYSFTPNYLQNTSSTLPDSELGSTSTTDVFINFTIDTTDDEVFVVYTLDGSAPTKDNGIVENAEFLTNEGNNSIWNARITYLPVNSELNYVIYTNSLDNGSDDLSNANNRISPNGFESSWTEGDAYYGPFYILPIKLSTFYAIENDNGYADIYWSTFSECNSSHFEIQRSLDNINFEVIDVIESQGGGFSCIGADYVYTDVIEVEDVNVPRVYYRLNMIDFDEYSYFSIVAQIDANHEKLIFYNVNQAQIAIGNIEGEYLLTVYDIMGNIIRQGNSNNQNISMHGASSGLYLVVLNYDNKQVTEKIIVP